VPVAKLAAAQLSILDKTLPSKVEVSDKDIR
jgi:hypothetical protein